ncbi:MAG: glycosyltransferase [Campylobacter sp.]|nr:glycosyltransferase [Campylobacter sp.]
MRILHTLHWVQFAGTERVCVDLCNEISKQNEVILLSNKNIENYISKNVKFINFDFEKNRRNPFFLYKTAKFIEKIRPDIIHCHNTKELEIMRYMQVFLKKKIPLIATKHVLTPKKKYALADLCVGILEDTFDIINSKNKIIIKNGMSYKTPKKLQMDKKFKIIFSGRLVEAKGLGILINALSAVKFDYICYIFGDGLDKEHFVTLVKELKLDEKIKFMGFVDNINDYLFSCDLQIIPSIFEPYGLVAIDGIYYSPLMISTNTGICEQILPSELKFSATPENLAHKLDEIHANYDKFVQIFAPIKAKKDEFSVAKMAQKYINAYENLIKDFKK